MDSWYTRNKSNTKRTTRATSLAVSAPTRKVSSPTAIKKALENSSRRGHSHRPVPRQKYYLMVRYRRAVLNSLRAKTKQNKHTRKMLCQSMNSRGATTESSTARRFLSSTTGQLSQPENWILPTAKNPEGAQKKTSIKIQPEEGYSQIT